MTSSGDMDNMADQLLAYAQGGKYQPQSLSLTFEKGGMRSQMIL
jgi:hypothetical protein